jgi:hypothetical protein
MSFATIGLAGLLGFSSLAHASDDFSAPMDPMVIDLAEIARTNPDDTIEYDGFIPQTFYTKSIEMGAIKYIVTYGDKGNNGLDSKDSLTIYGKDSEGIQVVDIIDIGLSGFPEIVATSGERGDIFSMFNQATGVGLSYIAAQGRMTREESQEARPKANREYLQLAFGLTTAAQRN